MASAGRALPNEATAELRNRAFTPPDCVEVYAGNLLLYSQRRRHRLVLRARSGLEPTNRRPGRDGSSRLIAQPRSSRFFDQTRAGDAVEGNFEELLGTRQVVIPAASRLPAAVA